MDDVVFSVLPKPAPMRQPRMSGGLMRLTDMILVQEHAAMLLQAGGECWICSKPTTDFKEPSGKWVHFSCDKRFEEHAWVHSVNEGDDSGEE